MFSFRADHISNVWQQMIMFRGGFKVYVWILCTKPLQRVQSLSEWLQCLGDLCSDTLGVTIQQSLCRKKEKKKKKSSYSSSSVCTQHRPDSCISLDLHHASLNMHVSLSGQALLYCIRVTQTTETTHKAAALTQAHTVNMTGLLVFVLLGRRNEQR